MSTGRRRRWCCRRNPRALEQDAAVAEQHAAEQFVEQRPTRMFLSGTATR